MTVVGHPRRVGPRRGLLATVAMLVVAMGLGSLPGVARSAVSMAELTVEMTDVGPQYFGFDHHFEIRVTNSGSEPVVDLVFAGDCGVVEGPLVKSGNADDVLDPAEVWTFSCSADGVPALAGVHRVAMTVTARTLAGEEVTERFVSGDFDDEYPASIAVIEPDGQLQIEPGSTATWVFEATNSSDLTLEARAEVLLFDWPRGPLAETPVGLIDLGDGDNVFDPGETWRGIYTVQLDDEGVYTVFIDVFVVGSEPFPGGTRIRRGEYDNSGGPVIVARTAPSATTTPATDDILPPTGRPTLAIALLATALVSFGALAQLTGRRHGRVRAR